MREISSRMARPTYGSINAYNSNFEFANVGNMSDEFTRIGNSIYDDNSKYTYIYICFCVRFVYALCRS